MILLGLTGPIGHGKTTFADALAELIPKTCRLESFYIVAEVADAMHAALRPGLNDSRLPVTPDPHDIESLNTWLRSLPMVLPSIVRTNCSFDQIQLKEEDIKEHPVEYKKLILHVENIRRNPELTKHKITQENKESYRPFLQWLGGYLVKKVDPGIWYNEIVRRVREAEQDGCQLCIVGGLRFPGDAAVLRQAGGVIVKVYRPGHLQNDLLDPTERERNHIQADCIIMSKGTADDIKGFAPKFLEDLRTNNPKPLYEVNPTP